MEIGSMKRTTTGTETWPKLALTPIEVRSWTETRTALLINQPAFADVWFRMMQDKDRELAWFTDQIPTAATDDRFMFINPSTFFKYRLPHRVFIACHEICHAIFNHCGMMHQYRLNGFIMYPDGLKLPYNENMCQVSTDCLVNDILVRGKVGEMPTEAWHGEADITYMDNISTAYRKLFEKQFGKGKKGLKNYNDKCNELSGLPVTPGGKGFDEHLKPGQGSGKTTTQAVEERNPQAWDNALAAALVSAKAQGKLSQALERGLSQLLAPKIEWRDHLQLTLSRRLGADFSTWNTLDNELMLRGIGAPSKSKIGCETIVFAMDSSGSINQKTADMFNTECVGLMEQARPRQLIYMQCDAKIHECVEIDDPSDLVRMIKGGGCTDFRPVFDRIEEDGLEPEVLIYITDLEGTFPKKQPPYPVIWVTIEDHTIPFGDKVLIPKQLSE